MLVYSNSNSHLCIVLHYIISYQQSVKFIVETLIRDGKIVRPILGISYLDSKQARVLGIDKGVLVLNVPTNTAAYKAGLRGTRRTENGTLVFEHECIGIARIHED